MDDMDKNKNKPEKTTGIVQDQRRLTDDVYSLTLECPPVAANCVPGQFVSLFCKDKSRLLPRPISICDRNAGQGTIRLVYRVAGAGTEEFSKLVGGDVVELMGPLGNGYPVDQILKAQGAVRLMGGGIGIPPMLLLARELGRPVEVVLGYRDVLFLKEDFEKIPGVSLFVATEDGSFGTKGTVMDAQPTDRPDVICACGPTPMLRAIRAFALENDICAYLSLEQRMACGVGACLACVCESTETDAHSRVNNMRICAEGPVFEADRIVL